MCYFALDKETAQVAPTICTEYGPQYNPKYTLSDEKHEFLLGIMIWNKNWGENKLMLKILVKGKLDSFFS